MRLPAEVAAARRIFKGKSEVTDHRFEVGVGVCLGLAASTTDAELGLKAKK